MLGLVSFSFISTGHELSLELFEGYGTILFLLLILFVRTTLTLSANVSGITGGMFLPILSLGALVSSILGKAFVPDSAISTIFIKKYQKIEKFS